MTHNSGDMDDLFRRAAEKYPLRTDSADWDRLAGELGAEPDLPSQDEQDRRRRRGAFWWFLLLPLAGAGYLTWRAAVHEGTSNYGIVRTGTAPASARSGRVATGAADLKENPLAGAAASQKEVSAGAHQTGSAVPPVSRQAGSADPAVVHQSGNADPAVVHQSGGADPAVAPQTSRGLTRNSARRTRKAGAGNRVSSARQTWEAPTVDRRHGATRAQHDPARVNEAVAGRSDDGENVVAVRRGAGPAPEAERQHELLWATLDLRRAPIGEGYHVWVNAPAPVVPLLDGASTVMKRPNVDPHSGHRSHGYIGFTAAPDFSTVKFQAMKGVGTTFGLLLGYSFNDRWAIESGVSVDRKRYYTDGEYFSTSKVRLYPNQQLLNVDGTCYMWEIPVNVRYNFSTNARMRFFGTAGLSAYLMSSENYSYQYDYSSGGTVETSHWTIKKPSQYWFTIVNISAGFEQRLGKIGNIRLEPYIRVPLSGIGTGNLPIMSAGLNIGLTHRLW